MWFNSFYCIIILSKYYFGGIMRKTVLVTGASGDLGSSIAEEFASEGYNVIVHYFTNKKRADDVCQRIKEKYGVETVEVCADLTLEDEVLNMFSIIEEEFGTLDVLVNNAAISNDSIFLDKKKEDFIKVYEANLIGPFMCSKCASKLMMKNKSGVIINISSTNADKTNYPYSADYDASKAALNSLGRNLAVELSPYIRVVTVAPGWINTQMNKDLDSKYIEEESNKILLKRFADVREISKVVVFLASADASYINNTVINVHGGFYE